MALFDKAVRHKPERETQAFALLVFADEVHLKTGKIGKILTIVLGCAQQEVGISIPILLTPYSKYKSLVSNSWISHLWQFLETIGGTIEYPSAWISAKTFYNDKVDQNDKISLSSVSTNIALPMFPEIAESDFEGMYFGIGSASTATERFNESAEQLTYAE